MYSNYRESNIFMTSSRNLGGEGAHLAQAGEGCSSVLICLGGGGDPPPLRPP